jgi:hypothetical protein
MLQTPDIVRPLRGALVLILLLGLAVPASASDVILKLDNLTDGGTAVVQGGFVEGETGGVILAAQAGQYPVTLKEIQVFVDKQIGVSFTNVTVQLRVWSTSSVSGATPSLASAAYTSPLLGFTAGAFNTWDISAANLVMTGPFLVGCTVVDTNFISLIQGNQPNLVTDNNGCQGGKNWVRQTNGQWANLCAFGVSGDLAIRVKASTGAGTGQFNNFPNGLAGNFSPSMTGSGSLAGGANFTIALAGLPTFTTTTLIVGLGSLFAPFKGGTLGPMPDLLIPLGTGTGALNLNGSMPMGLPSNFELWMQSWTPDAGAPVGLDATNTLQLITP